MGSIKRGTETNMIVLSPIYSLITLEMTVPGIPALILLMVTSAISIVYGIVSNPSSGGLNCAGINWFFTKSPKTVRAVATAIVALPFWIWAANKVAKGAMDLGVISFLLVLISSSGVVYSSNSNNPSSLTSSILLLISNACVSINYALPFFLYDIPLSFQVYLAIGVVYWVVVCFWNWKGRTISFSSHANYSGVD